MGTPKRTQDESTAMFLASELSPEQRAIVDSGGTDAETLRQQMEGMKQTRLMLLKLPPQAAPPDFSRSVQQRIRRTTHGRHFSGVGRFVFPYEAAVSVVVLIVLMVVYWMGESGGTLAPGGHQSPVPTAFQGLTDQVARIGGTVAGQTERCDGGMELWLRPESYARLQKAVEKTLVMTPSEGTTPGTGVARYCAEPR